MRYLEKHPLLIMAVGILGISLSSIFIRYSTAPSAVTAAFRLLWTILLMTPVVLGKAEVRRELRRLDRRSAVLSGLSGIFLAIHFLLWFESLRHTSVASAATLVCTEVIWVSIGFCLFQGGRIPTKAVFAISLALAGSVLIAWVDSGSGFHLYGDMLALMASVAAAIYMLIGRTVQKTISTTVYTYIVYAACGAVLVAVCGVGKLSLWGYGMGPVVIGALLAVFSTILGHSIFSWCLKFFSPSFASAAKLCEPVVASILAVFLFGEVPTLMQLAGGILILGGLYAYSRVEGRKQ